MNIAIFGATGLAGSAIVTEALTRGHSATAIARNLDANAERPGVTPHQLDVTSVPDAAGLAPALAGADAAVLTVRLAPGDTAGLLAVTTRFLDATERAGIRALIVGGVAPLHSPGQPSLLVIDDPTFIPPEWRAIAQASLAQFHVWSEHHGASSMYLSPPAVLEPGERTGRYRRGTAEILVDAGGASRIAAPDLAVAVLDALESPVTDRHFTVAAAE